jgi:hypothetical protein
MSSQALVIGFEGLVQGSNTASFADLGISDTYSGFQWTARGASVQPTGWAVGEVGPFGGVSAFDGTGFAWTFNGAQSMFVTFGGDRRTVAGGYFSGQFGSFSASATTLQMYGYDASNNLIARSDALTLADNRWQFLAGGPLATIPVYKLELRSNAQDAWFAIDNLEVGDVNVPEPTTLLLLGLGLVGIAGVTKSYA